MSVASFMTLSLKVAFQAKMSPPRRIEMFKKMVDKRDCKWYIRI